MKVEATLNVNGTDYPVEIDPHLSLLKAVRDEIGLTGLEGRAATTPSVAPA